MTLRKLQRMQVMAIGTLALCYNNHRVFTGIKSLDSLVYFGHVQVQAWSVLRALVTSAAHCSSETAIELCSIHRCCEDAPR